jgi:TolB-like protein
MNLWQYHNTEIWRFFPFFEENRHFLDTETHFCAVAFLGVFMKRNIVLALVFFMAAGYASAKDDLAILPFTGGQNDEGETIAELFSFDPALTAYFNPIPRTRISAAVSRERRFQMGSGMTDPDTIVSIAREVGARYVVAGTITSVGNRKLLVISILDILNLQQVAGDYQEYNNPAEIRRKLPDMAANIIRAVQISTTFLPKLAVVPVQLQGGADRRVADTLAQLLAINLIRSGNYAVYPRTESLEQVMAEHRTQMRGHTADENIIGIGHGENPDLVLSVSARRLGDENMFLASIISMETGRQVTGRSVDYQSINDGIETMETLAAYLISTDEQVTRQRQERDEAERREEQQRLAEERRAKARDSFVNNSGFILGFRAGISLAKESEHIDSNMDGWLWHIPLTITAGIQLGSLFSIESGFQFSLEPYVAEDGDSVIHFIRMQIPLLAKFTFSPGSFVFSPFAGIGFNTSIHTYLREYADSVSIPISGIIGADIGFKKGNTIFFADIRYVHDFGKTKLNLEKGDSIDMYSMGSVDISLGIEWIIPFRKTNTVTNN